MKFCLCAVSSIFSFRALSFFISDSRTGTGSGLLTVSFCFTCELTGNDDGIKGCENFSGSPSRYSMNKPDNISFLVPLRASESILTVTLRILCRSSDFQFLTSSFRNAFSCSDAPSVSAIFFQRETSQRLRINANISSNTLRPDAPESNIDFRIIYASDGSVLKVFTQRSNALLLPVPVTLSTSESVISFSPAAAITCSSNDNASRNAPSACRDISHNDSSSAFTFSFSHTYFNLANISSVFML